MGILRLVFRSCRWAALALLVSIMAAQEPAKVAPVVAPSKDQLKQLVKSQFGVTFELLEFPPLFLDIDGDGAEDAIVIATSKNPLLDAGELHYKVIDPYDDYFGLGDPKITAGFAPMNPGPPRYLLVVHAWREATPKAKFVLINVPFEKLSAGRVLRKKKPVAAISAEEAGGITSAVYWDGKKYKWQPTFLGQ